MGCRKDEPEEGLVGLTEMRVAKEDDLDLSRLGGDWGMQGRTVLNLGLMDPAEEAQEAPDDLEEDRDPCEEGENLSCVGA